MAAQVTPLKIRTAEGTVRGLVHPVASARGAIVMVGGAGGGVNGPAGIYEELATRVGGVACDSWQVLLLEDLGPKSAPPWTLALARRVTHAYGDFDRATSGQAYLPGCRGVRSRC
jgi:hypothetical protein